MNSNINPDKQLVDSHAIRIIFEGETTNDNAQSVPSTQRSNPKQTDSRNGEWRGKIAEKTHMENVELKKIMFLLTKTRL